MKVVFCLAALFAAFAACDGHSSTRAKPMNSCDEPGLEWTKFFNIYDADRSGDFEKLSEIVKKFPDDVCTHPTGIDYTLVSGYRYSSLSITLQGLICDNRRQRWPRRCGDYKVRFCCPKKVVCEGDGNEFTPFYDISSPDRNSGNDIESVAVIQKILGPAAVCSNPTAADARLLNGKLAAISGDTITVNNKGLTCLASSQKEFKKCQNYKVRFCCPKVVTPSPVCTPPATLTPFVTSKTTPFGATILLEDILKLFPDQFCPNPISFIVEQADGTAVDQSIIVNVKLGLVCFDAGQIDGKCKNFKIRFCCEEAICVGDRHEFTSFYDVSRVENGDEFENVFNIKNKLGNAAVCDNPKSADVRLRNGDPAINGGNILTINSMGLSCVGSQQPAGVACQNYKTRFCCPKRRRVRPFCPSPRKWTPFLRTTVQGALNFFSIEDAKQSGIVCKNPTSIEVQGGSAVTQEVTVDLHYGFLCFDVNQDNGICNKYRVRLCCEEPIISPTCSGQNEWGSWMNRDHPSDGSDIEEYVPPQARCFPNLGVDVRLAATQMTKTFYDDILEVTPKGLRCLGSQQDDGKCDDYEVRVCCPRDFIPPDCSDEGSEWTKWYDRDSPDDSGDIECLQLLRNMNRGQICKNPSSIDALVTNTGLPYYTSQDVVEIGPGRGLICKNSNQAGKDCDNYKVRFCCPKVFENSICSHGNEWTRWLDRDDPSFNGDFETLSNFISDENICKKPSSIRARIASTMQPSSESGETLLFSPSVGLICENRLQEDGSCEDYEVQFCCPIEYVDDLNCSGDNEWTDYYNQDVPTTAGETECLYLHRLNNPNDNICKDPSSIDVTQASGAGDYLGQRELVSVSPYGFFCSNGHCHDYQVRYCCPKRFLNPTCGSGSEWTSFQNVDGPDSGSGDIELVSGCTNPSSIQAVLVSNNQPYQTGGDFVMLSLTDGLKCINEEQFDGICNDYQVRFCCPGLK